MKKTDKKLEKVLITALTRVCEQALEEIEGFQWLTHQVNFNDFPRSLRVTCVFETRAQVTTLLDSPLQTFQSQSQDVSQPRSDRLILSDLILDELYHVEIHLNDRRTQIKFDSEEACLAEHGGKWNRRLS
ncbi:hypothetical protein A9Q77_08320 [Marinomonas sp. 42_23_T18]|nr:hypothetical protein A9Q77_08320 [Marinomonas sp. 42_23_T18]